jgi:predicted RNA-binding Zn ribbon-like protein
MDLSRLRQCHSHHIHRCILLFYDTTKSGTRQWCSTACLDRERSARRYEEKKRASES